MPRFPGEVGLIGISSISREIGGSGRTKLKKPLKAKDAVQRLRTIAERFLGAPPERALTETEAVPQLTRDLD